MPRRDRVERVIEVPSGFDATSASGRILRVQMCTEDIARIRIARDGQFVDGGLSRYGFVRDDWGPVDCQLSDSSRRAVLYTEHLHLTLHKTSGQLDFAGPDGRLLAERAPCWCNEDGFGAQFDLEPGERFVGFGDQTRDRIEHRGHRARMWVRNVSSYIPIPFCMSSRGYGLFVNSTWQHYYDMGCSDQEWFGFAGPRGDLDYYVIHGPTYADILDRYTQITGRPCIPPLWSFGLWYICHTDADARAMLDECLRFRDRDIPCDVVGLEPGWMERNYDFSVDKRWHPERFSIPPYCPRGPHNFMDAAHRMGFKVMLWLCCDYDLSHEEERHARPAAVPDAPASGAAAQMAGAFEVDEHLTGTRSMDAITRPEEPWFQHLSGFVDQGTELFKQDGANQVLEHPDRKWANGMDDQEMHNLYPLLYSKQMHQGFREHTGRRATCFTAAGYAGLQKWTGTWSGDTGGGPKPLVSMLNLSMSGHSLMTCDMEVTTKEGIHFGFLQPWAQLNNWNYWRQPWYQGTEIEGTFARYARLRYELVPYLYSMAHVAHRTGMPMLRAMPLVCPDDSEAYSTLTQYMLGDALLVSAFADRAYLPAGQWRDWWSGAIHEGPGWVDLAPPEWAGGGLFVKAGAVIPCMPCASHLNAEPWRHLIVRVVPGACGHQVLYEDDFTTYGYEDGQVCSTALDWTEEEGRGTLTIGAPSGPRELLPDVRSFEVWLMSQTIPEEATVDGLAVGTHSLADAGAPQDADTTGTAWGVRLALGSAPVGERRVSVVYAR